MLNSFKSFWKKYSDFVLLLLVIITLACCSFVGISSGTSKNYNNDRKSLHVDESTGNYVSDNLLNIADVIATTTNGITYSISNGVITLNGTASGGLTISCPLSVAINGNYEGSVFNTINSAVMSMYFECGSGPELFFNALGKFSQNVSNKTINYFGIYITSGATFDNVKFKPMLIKGNQAPTIFEPYGLIYYSQSNYDNFGSSRYDAGKLTGIDEAMSNYNIFEGATCKVYNMSNNLLLDSITLTGSRYIDGKSTLFSNVLRPSSNPSMYVNYDIRLVITLKDNVPASSVALKFDTDYSFDYIVSDTVESIEFTMSDIAGSQYFIATSSFNSYDLITSFTFNILSFDIDWFITVSNNGYLANSNISYQNGFNDGKVEGIKSVKTGSYYEDGYNKGFEAGKVAQLSEEDIVNVTDVLMSVIEYPYKLMRDGLNVTFLGINLANLLLFVLGSFVIIYVVKKVL